MTSNNPQPKNWIRPPYAKEESASGQMKKRKEALDAAEDRQIAKSNHPGDIFSYFDEMYKEVV